MYSVKQWYFLDLSGYESAFKQVPQYKLTINLFAVGKQKHLADQPQIKKKWAILIYRLSACCPRHHELNAAYLLTYNVRV